MWRRSEQAQALVQKLHDLLSSTSWFGRAKREESIIARLDQIEEQGEPAAVCLEALKKPPNTPENKAKPRFFQGLFAPASGVDEDPVTGSAHCCLADFWRKRLGKSEFVAFQASARGGVVKVRVVKDRALLGGKAVTAAKGELLVGEDEA